VGALSVRALAPGDRVRLVLGGPVFRVVRVTPEAVSLTPEARRIAVDHYGRRFSVTAGGVDVSPLFAPAERVEGAAHDSARSATKGSVAVARRPGR
jgi:hypothetical protein